ncbi:MAG: primosomal protein N' [Lachnospiraceae bacterium]|nr:primosomal protein N' [Lachnospiraceae bacterium]
MAYAEIIIDISTTALDRIFTYEIPEALAGDIEIGTSVKVPFGRGNSLRTGYVIRIKDEAGYDLSKIKAISEVVCDSSLVEGQLLRLAYWMKENYGSTYIQALMTVLPMKAKIGEKMLTYLHLNISLEDAKKELEICEAKHYKAKARLIKALIESGTMAKTSASKELNVSAATIKSLINSGTIIETAERKLRNPKTGKEGALPNYPLNEEQKAAFDIFDKDYKAGIRETYLLFGVTGAGKTEVYLSMIEEVIKEGKEAIVLIPEIALTYQTVRRFANRFGDLVTVIHSRLSAGEKYDQFERAKKGEVKVVIGPRSALFTPFSNLGLIVIDEEHENSYKSEQAPRYHARETAIYRAKLADASVVLGSATPSVESYERALNGEYKLLTLKNRVSDAKLPVVSVVDLREELKAKNFTMFSRELQKDLRATLDRGEQSMLFINRRGMAGFVSCIDCGHVIKCPHCDVSLKLHGDNLMICHYCGYKMIKPSICPECSSKHIKAFGTGTEKVCEALKKLVPDARILRMDADTTKDKEGHERILEEFASGDADILVGTQMIVKGHDFPKVTLVSALAADLSLFEQDFRSAEKTFDLLTQAAGRAGRGSLKGKMIIQTRHPDAYAIACASKQDYIGFYNQEIAFRRLADYPPKSHMLAVMMQSASHEELLSYSEKLKHFLDEYIKDFTKLPKIIGPAEAYVYKVKDIYRRVIYVKYADYQALIDIKNCVERLVWDGSLKGRVSTFFDFDPMVMF